MHRRSLWLLVLNLSLFLFIVWAWNTEQTFLSMLDEWGMNAITAQGESNFTRVARFFSAFSSYAICLGFGFILSFAFLYLKKYWVSALVLIGAAGTRLISSTLKNLFGRNRPPLDSLITTHGDAFPSGHVIYAVFLSGALFLFITCRYRSMNRFLFLLCGILFIALVAWSRVHLGAHYISDVLGGLFIGAIWLQAIWILALIKKSPDSAGA